VVLAVCEAEDAGTTLEVVLVAAVAGGGGVAFVVVECEAEVEEEEEVGEEEGGDDDVVEEDDADVEGGGEWGGGGLRVCSFSLMVKRGRRGGQQEWRVRVINKGMKGREKWMRSQKKKGEWGSQYYKV